MHENNIKKTYHSLMIVEQGWSIINYLQFLLSLYMSFWNYPFILVCLPYLIYSWFLVWWSSW